MDKKKQSQENDNQTHNSKGIWAWMCNMPMWYKVVFPSCIIVLIFFVEKSYFFQQKIYKFNENIFKVNASSSNSNIKGNSITDQNNYEIVPLTFTYDIEDEKGKRRGKLGDLCMSGNKIHISVKAGIDSWVTIIGIDAKRQPFPIFAKNFAPTSFNANNKYQRIFRLDDTVGNEIYYAIASSEQFSFNKEIKPLLDEMILNATANETMFFDYDLKMPDKFSLEFFYFSHLPKAKKNNEQDKAKDPPLLFL